LLDKKLDERKITYYVVVCVGSALHLLHVKPENIMRDAEINLPFSLRVPLPEISSLLNGHPSGNCTPLL
jgi:hypothetical protein